MNKEDRKEALKQLRVLALAKDFKYVAKVKNIRYGKCRKNAEYYLVEPFDITVPAQTENLRRIARANIKSTSRYNKVTAFEFDHPVPASPLKYLGPIVSLCLEKIYENLGKQVIDLSKNGAIFTVRKKNVPEDPIKQSALVKVTVYEPVDANQLKSVRMQDVIVGGERNSPKTINQKISNFQKGGQGK